MLNFAFRNVSWLGEYVISSFPRGNETFHNGIDDEGLHRSKAFGRGRDGCFAPVDEIRTNPDQSGPIRQDAAATGTDGKKSVALTVAPAGVHYGQKPSIPVIFGGKPQTPSGHEKSLVSQGKTRLFNSRGDRIRTYDPLVPNQMR